MPPVVSPPVSPCEILEVLLNGAMDAEIVPFGCVVGPVSDQQAQGGVVSLTEGGATSVDTYVPIIWARIQIRCLAPTLATVDAIGFHVAACVFDMRRIVVTTPSTGQSWLVYGVTMATMPSHHYNTAEDFEALMYVTLGVSACTV